MPSTVWPSRADLKPPVEPLYSCGFAFLRQQDAFLCCSAPRHLASFVCPPSFETAPSVLPGKGPVERNGEKSRADPPLFLKPNPPCKAQPRRVRVQFAGSGIPENMVVGRRGCSTFRRLGLRSHVVRISQGWGGAWEARLGSEQVSCQRQGGDPELSRIS